MATRGDQHQLHRNKTQGPTLAGTGLADKLWRMSAVLFLLLDI